MNREVGELPEGAKSTDEEDNSTKNVDPYKALDINLDELILTFLFD